MVWGHSYSNTTLDLDNPVPLPYAFEGLSSGHACPLLDHSSSIQDPRISWWNVLTLHPGPAEALSEPILPKMDQTIRPRPWYAHLEVPGVAKATVWERCAQSLGVLAWTSVYRLLEVQEGTGVWEKKGSGFGARVVHLYSYPALPLSEEGLPRGPSPFWPTAYLGGRG